MSISDERDLAERLGGALAAVTPARAPLAAVLRKGRAIRAWRRIAVVAAAALAVAGISAGVPLLLRAGPAPSPPAAARPPVTVHRPGPGSPPGLIAWGAAGGKRWRATISQATGGLIGFCIAVTAMPPQCASPVNLTTVHGHGESATTGPVWHGVARVGVWLSDGTVLWLHPVAAYGLRWVAFVLPARVTIVKVAAYAVRGELAYAAPYRGEKTTWHQAGAAASP
jgi:hypothetical protein